MGQQLLFRQLSPVSDLRWLLLATLGFVAIPAHADDLWEAPTEERLNAFADRLQEWVLDKEPTSAFDPIEDSNPDANDDVASSEREDDYAFSPSDLDEDEESVFSNQVSNKERIAKTEGGRFVLPKLKAPSIATDQIGNGRVPKGFRGENPALPRLLPESGSQRGAGNWPWMGTRWAAANTFSHPRYFEDRMLERHGQERFPLAQPLVSGARFFATVPMLPYLMTVRPPCDYEYTLGYFRTGSCTPAVYQRPPFHAGATAVEAAAIAAGIAALP